MTNRGRGGSACVLVITRVDVRRDGDGVCVLVSGAGGIPTLAQDAVRSSHEDHQG